ncbi:hypothetical protein BHE90_009921 [Fusarium euwallaceae]|uniref:Uncharacterized protein n=2 Tax=Fusarium solani species complex TaxID=232080 RepID=A0A3M2S772_9HYPO|nr:hypothetical protein CDV36_006966 [Fusarium kuroshium]RTE75614.1 hypothetical protein BHE90_009921 [Fusarium euwallaceae]
MLIKTHERVLVRSSQEERGDERNKFTARLQEPACSLPMDCGQLTLGATHQRQRDLRSVRHKSLPNGFVRPQ